MFLSQGTGCFLHGMERKQHNAMTILLLKVMKYVGVSLFAAGIFAALFSQQTRQRSVAAHWVATTGFLLTWIAGYGAMKAMGYKLSSPWIVNSIVASTVVLAATLYAVGSQSMRPWLGALATTGFVFSLVAMTFRSAACGSVLSLILPVAFASSLVAMLYIRGTHEENLQTLQQDSLHWFVWIARIEGLSLLVLLGLYMPLRYGIHIVLDGGHGWFGWIHGIFQVIYVAGLFSTAKWQGWSLQRSVGAFVASLLPFGTWLFERKIRA